MRTEEQDKLWALLSEESKYHYQTEYNNRLEDAKRNPEGGGDLTVLTSQYIAEDLEKIFGKHNLQFLTYEDIANELFTKKAYCCDFNGKVIYIGCISSKHFDKLIEPNNCTSQKQVEKLLAINKLLNVAKFLNKNEDGSDWVPTIEDWDDLNSDFFTFGIDPADNEVHVITVNKMRLATEIVYFRTKELAQQAVQILGEDVVITALTTEY